MKRLIAFAILAGIAVMIYRYFADDVSRSSHLGVHE
ncbi:hypothetical protein MNBD_ACTINO02-1362 [hydrothermal vent metagenome]|uniref:Uncharacterized protein n=1 Tax=hydrothermal vent metagenome TaxID=652676 RepID=A0A3B0SRC2_9ZZZZ